jgi:4-methylaminobutanoate oxidase (formaldehyde-forming)
MTTARGARRSPFYDRLAARGAYFRDVSGWEGADWYLPGRNAIEQHSWKRQHWWGQWQDEHRAAREGAIVMDMSFMAKFVVAGRDAGAMLDWISANSVDGQAGQITYTQWLDDAGKLQADLTVTKLDDDRYWVVASDTAHRHVETWMRRHFEDRDARASVTDVTGGYAQLNVQGPRSREVMQRVTGVDMSNDAFPFRAAREIDIGYARVLCIRITYLGELGYELYIPAEQALHVYDRLVAEGEPVGLVHAGLKTLASCRMEKGYRDYGHDIDNTDSVLEAGLGFAVDLKKPSFVGKDAVAALKAAGPLQRRLVQVKLDDPEPLMFHAEIVRRDGAPVGYIRAASYGHTIGGAVGLAMVKDPGGAAVDAKWLAAGKWEVEVANARVPATVSLKPFYDPENKRVKM